MSFYTENTCPNLNDKSPEAALGGFRADVQHGYGDSVDIDGSTVLDGEVSTAVTHLAKIAAAGFDVGVIS